VSKGGGRRRRGWLIASGIVLVLLVWAGVLAVKTWSAYRHDQKGLASLQQVRANLNPDELTTSGTVQALDEAQLEFDAAQSDLSSPLFDPVTVIPVVGRQLRSVRALSSAAGSVSAVGSSFLSQVHSVLDQPHNAGPERVTSLRHLGALSLSAEQQLSRIDTGPSQALVSPLAGKHNEFVTQLDDARLRLTKAAGVSAAVATILQGPQSYVVLASNEAEMRAGSGTFLEVGTAATADGSVKLGDLGPSGDHSLSVGAVPVAGDLQRNWGWLHPSLDMRNLGLTPQFDVTAPLAARMWTASTGEQVDGVLALDVAGLRQLLEATGPVEANGRTVSADDVEQYLLHDQYVGLTETSPNSSDREAALGALAGAVLRQLQGQTTDLKSLANATSSAVAGRHLMIWSKNPAAEAAWVASGVSGSLTAQSVDVSLINLSGNKLDQYVPIRVVVSTKRAGSRTAVTLTTRLTNMTPPGEPQFVAGPFLGSPVSYGEYIGLVATNLPATATRISVTGAGPLAAKGAEGPTWLAAVPVTLLQGVSSTVVIHFLMPGSHGSMTLVPSARIPPEQWTANGKTFDDSAPATITW
jgi:hypothetical protein